MNDDRNPPQTPATVTGALALAEYELCEALDILSRVGGYDTERTLPADAVDVAYDYLCLARVRLKETGERLGFREECVPYLLAHDPREQAEA